jgi:hypothetical protein
MIKNIYIGLHIKYPLFLSDHNDTWIFWADLKKFTKECQVGAKSFHGNRHDAVNSLFHNFKNPPNYGTNFDDIC